MFLKFACACVCAVMCLGLLGGVAARADERREAIDKLIGQLESADWRDRLSAAVGLGGAGTDARHALPALWRAGSDEHETVRRWADRSARRIYKSLRSDIPLEQLVRQIAAEPPPPKWSRISAAEGVSERALSTGGLAFGDGRVPVGEGEQGQSRQAMFPGILQIRIPLPHEERAHGRFVGNSVSTELGELRVELTNGYVPELWEEREIIAARTLRGRFARLTLPELPAGRKWLVIYDDLEHGFDLDRDGRADVTLRVAPSDFAPERE